MNETIKLLGKLVDLHRVTFGEEPLAIEAGIEVYNDFYAYMTHGRPPRSGSYIFTYMNIIVSNCHGFVPNEAVRTIRQDGTGGTLMWKKKQPAVPATPQGIPAPTPHYSYSPGAGAFVKVTTDAMDAAIKGMYGIKSEAEPFGTSRIACECGASAVKSNHHSSWCPKHDPLT